MRRPRKMNYKKSKKLFSIIGETIDEQDDPKMHKKTKIYFLITLFMR